MKYLLSIVLLTLAFNVFANDVYMAVGVKQYQESGKNMIAQGFSVGQFSDSSSCNAEVANQNNLTLQNTPKSSNNSAQRVDAICHPILPVQMPGYWIVGTGQIQQNNVATQPIDTKIGPFATAAICNARLTLAKALTLQNTPKTGNNVGYALDGDCVYLLPIN